MSAVRRGSAGSRVRLGQNGRGAVEGRETKAKTVTAPWRIARTRSTALLYDVLRCARRALHWGDVSFPEEHTHQQLSPCTYPRNGNVRVTTGPRRTSPSPSGGCVSVCVCLCRNALLVNYGLYATLRVLHREAVCERPSRIANGRSVRLQSGR